MSRLKHKHDTCHVTDDGDVVHIAQIHRGFLPDGRIQTYMVTVACVAVSAGMSRGGADNDAVWRGWDLPKTRTGAGLLVKYEPRTPAAPPLSCVACITWESYSDVWKP